MYNLMLNNARYLYVSIDIGHLALSLSRPKRCKCDKTLHKSCKCDKTLHKNAANATKRCTKTLQMRLNATNATKRILSHLQSFVALSHLQRLVRDSDSARCPISATIHSYRCHGCYRDNGPPTSIYGNV